ncbi:DotU family type IV/VI secretion system protein [Enterobacteriaceae bacterium 9_2_54FAA]|nr:DotU family type IV/VI secretion system protein [Enterobacteriaceae bacterium 9_2_54FAA]
MDAIEDTAERATETKGGIDFKSGLGGAGEVMHAVSDDALSCMMHKNPLIEASSPLLGFINRIKSLNEPPVIEPLIAQIEQEIKGILQRLEIENYEPGILLSWSYFFCTFIDEMVMAKPWGVEGWAQHTLLVRFHSETWGGEKCFQLIDRLLLEPARYRDLLAFIHLCLCLGFQGRYRMTMQYQEDREKILRNIHQKLQALNKVDSTKRQEMLNATVMHYGKANNESRYRLNRYLSGKKVLWGIALAVLLGYGMFDWSLHSQTQNIITQLNALLP